MQRIARKPMNSQHKRAREFYKKGGGWLLMGSDHPKIDDPLYLPACSEEECSGNPQKGRY